MLETFMVLVVIMIILGIGMYFFYGAVSKSTKETASEACMMSETELLSTLTSMPELQCTSNGVPRAGCIDVIKMQAAIDTGALKKKLEKGICQKSIAVEQFYPAPTGTVGCEAKHIRSGDFDGCSNWTLYEPANLRSRAGARILAMPVSLYYSTLMEYRIGMVRMRVYPQG